MKASARRVVGMNDEMRWTHLRWLGVLLAGLALVLGGRAQAGEYIAIGDTVELYYEEAGEGPPIVFIPGWTMTTEVFERQLEHFSKGYRAIAFDPRGQGRSSKTLEGHTYAQHARDLKAFMDALGLEDVVLVSWSWGVMEHLAYLREFGTDNIVATVFIDGAPKSATEHEGDWGDGSLQEVVYYPRTAIYDRHRLNREFAQWMLEDTGNPDVLAWINDQSLKTPNYVAGLLGYDAMFSDYTAELMSLDGTMPVLQVLREEWSRTATAWIKKNTPEAEVFVLGKHMMFWERADAFNRRLEKFLDAVFAPPPEEAPQPSELVRQIQTGLNALGYKVGKPDGLPGPGTEEAIRRYERDHSLLVTGMVSEPLLRHIGTAIKVRDAAAAEAAAQPEPEPAGPPPELVRPIQAELVKRGYDVPRITGALDPKTVEAVRAYQGDAGLLVDGQVSEALLAHLRKAPVGLAASRNRREQVRSVQPELNRRGYVAGPADGAMGERTRTAIRAFQ
jgi:peptidoglycan hydrolase-like protein with peptidoglycan-binding domain/pimeloyl-ACP methyl ester carboxylesterase